MWCVCGVYVCWVCVGCVLCMCVVHVLCVVVCVVYGVCCMCVVLCYIYSKKSENVYIYIDKKLCATSFRYFLPDSKTALQGIKPVSGIFT